MFQPQPTPYASSFAAGSYGVRDEFPEYGLYPTTLFGGGGGSNGAGVGPAGPGSGAAIFSSSPAVFGPSPVATPATAANGQQLDLPGSGHMHHLILQRQQQQHSHAHPYPSSAFKYASSTHTNHNTNPPQMASSSMEPGVQDDLAAQEAAAKDYEPQLEGPCVGEKTTSHAITDEYAKADQVYVAKTIALPQTYSHYRPIQGDGNCGWRAIGFAYFETLIRTATPAKFSAELERLTALNDYILNVGGYNPFVWETMAEETLELLSRLTSLAADPEAALALLETKFNEADSANAIIFHLRILAASYLIGHSEYEPFIPDDGISLGPGSGGNASSPAVKNYVEGTVLPMQREIDHLGITLLVGVLLEPADFVLEIAYLDRSPGTLVNIYRFPESANGQDEANLGPMIHLLFRPDHYDILYKPEPPPVDVQVHRVDSFSQHHQNAPSTGINSFSSLDFGVLALLPGYGGPAAMSCVGPAPAPPPPQQQPQHQPAPPLVSESYTPSPEATPAWAVQSFPDQISMGTASGSVAASTPSPPHMGSSGGGGSSSSHPLRFSKYSYPGGEVAESVADVKCVVDDTRGASFAAEQQTMTTTTFKNSHFNVAHFNNPNFQPEEYRPGDDDGVEPRPGRKKREKSAKAQQDD